MTKRQKLTAELNRKQRILDESLLAQQCNCECHQPGTEILHFIACCTRYNVDIDQLQSEIQELKRKLKL